MLLLFANPKDRFAHVQAHICVTVTISVTDETSLKQTEADTLMNWLKATLQDKVHKVKVCTYFNPVF